MFLVSRVKRLEFNKRKNKYLCLLILGFSVDFVMAGNLTCDEEYIRLQKDFNFTQIEEKIHRWESLGAQCKGSGVYEMRLGSLYIKAKLLDKAKVAIEDGISYKTDYDKQLRFQLADFFFMQKKFDLAAEQASGLINDYPEWFGGYFKLGQIQLNQQLYQEAIDNLEIVNEMEKSVDSNHMLILAYHQIGDHKRTVISMQRAMKIDLEKSLRQRLGVVTTAYSLMALEHLDEAKSLLLKHQELRPESRDDIIFIKAVLYLESKYQEQE